MLELAITPAAAQTLNVVLAQQNCRINLYQKSTGLFFDLFVSGEPVATCVICRNDAFLVNRGTVPFVGNFLFVDTMGELNPQWDGLGIRFKLIYVEPGDA